MTSKEAVKEGIKKAIDIDVEFDDEPVYDRYIDDENTDRDEPEDD